MTLKRVIDVVAAGSGLIILSPLLALLALMVRLSDGGPTLFAQTRVGHRGKPFRIFKFRTMTAEAHRGGLAITAGTDRRITPLGRILRRTKLDELPQLWNVVRGDMSLVGPRPEVPEYVALYSPEQRRVLDAVPGITDPASLAYIDEEALLARAADPHACYVQEIMPAKLRINLEYASRATVLGDLRIIMATVLRRSGASTRR